jgi:hypothetical protein
MTSTKTSIPISTYIICPAIPSPTPAIIPAAAIHPTVGLAAAFVVVPTMNAPPVVVAVPNTAQLSLAIPKQACELKELQILVALATPKFCAVGATVTPAPLGATIVTPKVLPCKSFVQAA